MNESDYQKYNLESVLISKKSIVSSLQNVHISDKILVIHFCIVMTLHWTTAALDSGTF